MSLHMTKCSRIVCHMCNVPEPLLHQQVPFLVIKHGMKFRRVWVPIICNGHSVCRHPFLLRWNQTSVQRNCIICSPRSLFSLLQQSCQFRSKNWLYFTTGDAVITIKDSGLKGGVQEAAQEEKLCTSPNSIFLSCWHSGQRIRMSLTLLEIRSVGV